MNDLNNVAKDLKQAFMDKSIKAVMTAIGGEDTYKTFSYLMEDEEFIQLVNIPVTDSPLLLTFGDFII